jgi:hypothetical protein
LGSIAYFAHWLDRSPDFDARRSTSGNREKAAFLNDQPGCREAAVRDRLEMAETAQRE